MKVVSLFDGIACGKLALERAGLPISEYHAYEIDKYALKVSKANHHDILYWGDVTQSKFTQFVGKDIDLLIGGSPCTDLSFAGKQMGFDNTRSGLFFDYVRALEVIKPKYFLLENVVMKKEYEEIITKHLGVKPLMINSSLLSAQSRKRLYWTNIPNVTQPIDKHIYWKDVRDNHVNEMNHYYSEKALMWLAKHSREKNKLLRVHQELEKMQMIEASHAKNYSSQRFLGVVDMPSDDNVVGAMRGRRMNVYGKRSDYSDIPITQMIEFRYDGKTNCLTTVCKDNVVVPFTLPERVPAHDFFFRFLTPEECERLQTIPTGYTSSVAKTHRYKMIGNAWTVDVISHILKHIEV